MKTINALLSIIILLLIWIGLNLIPHATADRGYTKIDIVSVGGSRIHDGKVPTK